MKEGVLRNFIKFTGKHLCQSLFFFKKKRPFIKKETLAQVFYCEFCEIFYIKNIFIFFYSRVKIFLKTTRHLLLNFLWK